MSIERRLNKIVQGLAWPKLEHNQAASGPDVITYYRSDGGEEDLFLQVNTTPCLCACVYALGHGLCSGWHIIPLSKNREDDQIIAEELSPWLGMEWFVDPKMRRKYRHNHPECAGYSWDKMRKSGEPYLVVTEVVDGNISHQERIYRRIRNVDTRRIPRQDDSSGSKP